MRKKISNTLINHFLYYGPKKSIERINRINPMIKIESDHLPSEQTSINQFLSHIGYEELENSSFSLLQANSNVMMKCEIEKLTNKKPKRKSQSQKSVQCQLVICIKMLLEDKHQPTLFLQTIEVFSKMNNQSGRRLKRHLLFLYRWTINQNGRIPSITKDLNQDLKKIVLQKLNQSFQGSSQFSILQDELKRIEILAKARESIAKGDFCVAKINYEAIFQDSKNEASIRMEALEYLCRESSQKGDENYLMEIANKISGDRKEQHHRQYIMNTIEKIKKNITKTPHLDPEK